MKGASYLFLINRYIGLHPGSLVRFFRCLSIATIQAQSIPRHLIFLFGGIAFVTFFNIAYAVSPVTVDQIQEEYHLGRSLEILEDPGGELTLDDVSSPENSDRFFPSSDFTPIFGYTNSVYWVRFRLVNSTREELHYFLQHNHSFINRVSFYQLEKGEVIDSGEAGRMVPFSRRDIPHRFQIFKLTIEPNTENVIYMRFSGTGAMIIPLKLSTADAFIRDMGIEQTIVALYYGVMIAMFFYNLFLCISLRDKNYLYYIAFLLTMILYQLNADGLGYQYLWSGNEWLSRYFVIFVWNLVLASYVIFSRSFLNTRRNAYFIDRILISFAVAAIINAVISQTGHMVLSFKIGLLIQAIGSVLLLIVGFICIRKNYKPAYYYVGAMSFLLIGAILTLLKNGGVLPSNLLTIYGSHFGSAMEAILLSLGLADRINTIRKEKEEALQEVVETKNIMVENLQKADIVKDEFLANTTHELKTPIHGIVGLSEALLKDSNVSLSETQRKDLNTIVISGKKLSALVENILDYSRLKHEGIKLHLRPVDVESLANLVFRLAGPLAESKQILLKKNIPENLPAVMADENRLIQILHNLIGNAIKFTDSGSITLEALDKKGTVELHLTDTGIGIKSENIDEIFKSFKRPGEDRSHHRGGVGLGLAITKRLIDAHNGTISVDSEEGKGSRFIVTLPSTNEIAVKLDNKATDMQIIYPKERVEHRAEVSMESPLQQDTPSTRYSILAVDDDPVNNTVVQRYLASPSYSVRVAENGMEALNALQRDGVKPDLILLDVMMPVMSGFELCNKIRQMHSMTELPVIFLTAKNQVSDLTEAFSMGSNDYITKPFTKEELITRINSQLLQSSSFKRLASLRDFAGEISGSRELKNVYTSIFQCIKENLDFSNLLLLHDNKVIESDGWSESKNAISELKHLLGSLPDSTNAIEIYNAFAPENQPKAEKHHLAVLSPDVMDEYRFVVIRDGSQSYFHSTEVEYLKNILEITAMFRNNLREFASDTQLMKAIHDIYVLLPTIVYIKSERSYCEAVFEPKSSANSAKKQQNPGSETFFIHMQTLQTYFREEDLLRVHRSYFINPEKMVEARRKSPRSPDYEILLKTDTQNPLTIPVGRSYQNRLKRHFPELFGE